MSKKPSYSVLYALTSVINYRLFNVIVMRVLENKEQYHKCIILLKYRIALIFINFDWHSVLVSLWWGSNLTVQCYLCRFGDEGARCFCKGMEGNITLLSVSMCYCDLGVESGDILGKMLVKTAVRYYFCDVNIQLYMYQIYIIVMS